MRQIFTPTHVMTAAAADALPLPGRGQALAPPHGTCHVCKLPECNETVFYDAEKDRVHDFCSKSHANEAIARGFHPNSNRKFQNHKDPNHRYVAPSLCLAALGEAVDAKTRTLRFRNPDHHP